MKDSMLFLYPSSDVEKRALGRKAKWTNCRVRITTSSGPLRNHGFGGFHCETPGGGAPDSGFDLAVASRPVCFKPNDLRLPSSSWQLHKGIPCILDLQYPGFSALDQPGTLLGLQRLNLTPTRVVRSV